MFSPLGSLSGRSPNSAGVLEKLPVPEPRRGYLPFFLPFPFPFGALSKAFSCFRFRRACSAEFNRLLSFWISDEVAAEGPEDEALELEPDVPGRN